MWLFMGGLSQLALFQTTWPELRSLPITASPACLRHEALSASCIAEITHRNSPILLMQVSTAAIT